MGSSSFKSKTPCDVLILGAGVVGLATGIALLESKPSLKVIIAEKEANIGLHASGRNSGVLHSGFYYSPNSLKAKFCREGNSELRKLARKYSVPVRNTGKVVVTQNSKEIPLLETLYRRGIDNGVELELLTEDKLPQYEPLAVTVEKFLWSPTAAVSDPIAISQAMLQEFIALGGRIDFGANISLSCEAGSVYDSLNIYEAKQIINAAGAQADRISRTVGVGLEYAMLPFIGLYRETSGQNIPLQRLVYPVPHSINPFLGIHFTLTLDGKVKIGPTAIPVLGREQYSLMRGVSGSDFKESFKGALSIVLGPEHDFSKLILNEWPNFFPGNILKKSRNLVPNSVGIENWKWVRPAIRAQLVHKPTGRLEQDFVIKGEFNALHILNAVSPGWTSSIPFGRFVSSLLNV